MATATIRPAYSKWADYNKRLREVVGGLTDEQLLLKPSAERWPLWATDRPRPLPARLLAVRLRRRARSRYDLFHQCRLQRPGDDDTENVLNAQQLVEAVDTTFQIVDGCLDRWTLSSLEETLRRPEWDDSWVHTRGAVIQRVFSHDVYHIAEANEILAAYGIGPVDLWD